MTYKKTFTYISAAALIVSLLFGWMAFDTPLPASAATDVKNDATLSTGLVSYYEYEDQNWLDSHGSNDLTESGTVSNETGIQGNAANFEAAGGDGLITQSVTGFTMTPTASFSAAGWVKADSANTIPSNAAIACRWQAGNKGFILWVNSSDQLQAYVGDKNTTRNNVSGTTDIDDGSWHHVAMVWNDTIDKQCIYVDGSFEGCAATSVISQSTANVEFGEDTQAGSCSNMTGSIDEFGIWSVALATTSITALYNSGSGIPYDAGGGGGGGGAAPQPPLFFSLIAPPKYVSLR